jgi:hypothetical protein
MSHVKWTVRQDRQKSTNPWIIVPCTLTNLILVMVSQTGQKSPTHGLVYRVPKPNLTQDIHSSWKLWVVIFVLDIVYTEFTQSFTIYSVTVHWIWSVRQDRSLPTHGLVYRVP